LAETYRNRRRQYEKLGLTVQPIIVADTVNHQYYILFDDVQYRFTSILRAVDVSFKLHQVLHLKYNHEVVNTWTFIQKGIYKLATKYDKASPSTTAAIKKFTSYQSK